MEPKSQHGIGDGIDFYNQRYLQEAWNYDSHGNQRVLANKNVDGSAHMMIHTDSIKFYFKRVSNYNESIKELTMNIDMSYNVNNDNNI